ncbi:general substrate transporter [Chlamydoabsidia padenii]|nr:general substrate transporter [Chlamydoabsidia padenii]
MSNTKCKVNYGHRNYLATNSPTDSLLAQDEQPKPFRQSVYLSSLVAAFGGALCGYDTGCISSIIAMDIFKKRFFIQHTYTHNQGLLLVFYLITASLGSLSSGYFCDRFSRKYSIVGATVIICIGVLAQIIGYNFGLLCAGRLITGFGAGLLTNAINLYHSEISPPDIRGRLVSLFTLMNTFGQVVGYFIAFASSRLSNDWSWRFPWVIQLLCGANFGYFVLTLTFSPRWLMEQGRKEEALMVLSKLNGLDCRHPTVQNEFNEIRKEIDFERSLGKRSYGELFQDQHLRRTLIAFFISTSTSFTGSVAIWYYAPQILVNAGLSNISSSIAITGGSGILSLVSTALSLQFLIDRLGRVALFQIGAALMAVSMFVVGGIFWQYAVVDTDTGGITVSNDNARNTIIVFIYIFTSSFAFSYGIASYVYPAEIFSMRCRAKGLSLSYGLNWVSSIIITYSVPLFMAYTVSGVYFFFGSCCVVCLVGVSFIPETKGKSLEEMETLFCVKNQA